MTEAIIANAAIWIDLIYGDSEGGQRTIVRLRVSEREDESCRVNVLRYWNLDREDPR